MPNLIHNNFTPETLSLHAAYNYDTQRTVAIPLYQSSSFSFENLTQAGNRFALKELGNIYTRLTNPTIDILGARLASVEGGAFGVPVASGSAAVFYTILNLAQNKDNIIYANKIYGGTQTLFAHSLKRFGIEARVFDIDNLSTLEPLIDDDTKAIFFESISNPQISIANSKEIVKIAKKYSIVTICDNTVATPLLFRTFDFGIDISVHSLTKYINGHGNALGGAIIERNNLNDLIKNNPRYKAFNEPDPSYHGLIYADLPLPIFSIRIITEWLRNTGATLSPMNAWLHLQGLETLDLRIKKHSDSALAIAEFLENHSLIEEVNYPGLKSNPYNKLLKEYFIDSRASGLISFEAKDSKLAQQICNLTELYSLTANIGDARSLIIHPQTTTHSQLNKEELKSAGITENTVRLSIGLENVDDLINDLKKAIES